MAVIDRADGPAAHAGASRSLPRGRPVYRDPAKRAWEQPTGTSAVCFFMTRLSAVAPRRSQNGGPTIPFAC